MRSARASRFPPGPRPRSWDGVFGAFQRDPLEFLPRAAKKYGDVVGLRFLNFRTLLLSHPDDIEDVLVRQPRKFSKGRILKANKRLFGEGLLTSEGDFWLRQRRLAQPAFHRARVARYAETMVAYAQRILGEWRDGEVRDIQAEMMRLTLEIVGKTLFDADVREDTREVGRTLAFLLKVGSNFRRMVLVPPWLPTPGNIRIALAIRKIEKIIYRIIARRRASGRDAGDLLSMLLAAEDEDGSHMTDKQLRDETLTLFLAGHETTANTLTWTWWLLAQNPEAERKLHRELDEVLGGRAPALEDLPKLPYLDRVLTESLRLYPPAWGIARLVVEECEVAGYPLVPGMGVAFAQWIVHRDPRWFEAPGEFRPDRWEGDLQKRLPRFAYFPFGGGPRQCIGNAFALMEAALVLATVAQRFRLKLVAGQKVEPLASITLRPRHGINVLLEKRL